MPPDDPFASSLPSPSTPPEARPDDPLSAALLGAAGGLRSMTPLATLAQHLADPAAERHAVADGPLADTLAARLLDLVGSPWGQVALTLAAGGELLADKLPFIPARVDPLPLAGRVATSALAAALLAHAQGRPADRAALVGGLAAAVASFLAYGARRWLSQHLPLPGLVWAVGEDLLALRLATRAVGD